jgi:Fur family ferric uptake transcriptional regulator
MERSRAGLTPTLPAVTPDGAVDALRASGRRVSAARRLVLEALFCADGPMSADQIADGIGGRVPRSDLTSVYRNLETLEEVGLVSHVHLGHGPGLYALNLAGEREWLTCERCGDFRAVDPARLDGVRAAIEAAFGYRASFAHFPVVGLCESCLSALGGSIST